jgi:adenylate cyclase class 2
MSGRPVETEVKFRTADLSALRARLIARGARVTQMRHLERNTLFDDASHSLADRGLLLRLRSAIDACITFKAPAPPDAQSTQHKARIEIETVVGDYDAAFAILTALGYAPAWRYEKYRESFGLNDVIVSLDHTPIGDFVEIEGPPDSIRPAAEQLGFDWAARNTQTYRELFAEAGLTDRTDMVF